MPRIEVVPSLSAVLTPDIRLKPGSWDRQIGQRHRRFCGRHQVVVTDSFTESQATAAMPRTVACGSPVPLGERHLDLLSDFEHFADEKLDVAFVDEGREDVRLERDDRFAIVRLAVAVGH